MPLPWTPILNIVNKPQGVLHTYRTITLHLQDVDVELISEKSENNFFGRPTVYMQLSRDSLQLTAHENMLATCTLQIWSHGRTRK